MPQQRQEMPEIQSTKWLASSFPFVASVCLMSMSGEFPFRLRVESLILSAHEEYCKAAPYLRSQSGSAPWCPGFKRIVKSVPCRLHRHLPRYVGMATEILCPAAGLGPKEAPGAWGVYIESDSCN